MRLGIYLADSPPVPEVLALVANAAESGLDSVYFNQALSWDAATVAAVALREVPGIEVGTAVVQTYPRHPVVLAAQARTIAALAPGRFTLGVGPSHPPIIEGTFGLSYDRPAQHLREYLSVLMPLLRGEAVDADGPMIRAAATITVPDAPAPPVLLSALGPKLLRLAGELADGVVTVWSTPEFVADHIAPAVRAAADAAGRPAPRVATIVSAVVTDDPSPHRAQLAHQLAPVSALPSYRRVLERQGLRGVHETALIGPEDIVAEGIRAYARAGVTDLLVSLRGDPAERARTRELLAAVRRD
ncbi:TIGR03564 family F420-dependent LLM class oxidoreductase [Nocardia sp. NPDC003482]